MADYLIMKAVEFDKLPAKFKKQYVDEQGLIDAGFWLQKKYDGCMGIAVVAHPSRGKLSRMLSRTGEDYTSSCGHILKELEEALGDSDRLDESIIVIGEVWQPIEEATFPTISGKFRRQSPSPELQFVANDLLPSGFNTDKPYAERFQELQALLGDDDPAFKVRVATTFFDMIQDPVAQALEWQGQGGFDGAVIRNPDAGYTVGTVKNGEIVKVKPVMSLDLRCTDHAVEPGEKTGRAVVTVEVEYQGVKSWVGSGVPHNIDVASLQNSIIEVECLGVTEDGRLREPRFKGIRFDKREPD